MLDRKIYCFWTGDNPINDNRKRAIDELRRISEIDVELVTKDNIEDYISFPLHTTYEYLSYVHRSDYLRAHFMHYKGGGYSDIKYPSSSWRASFDSLDNNDDKLGLGYREIGRHGIALVGGQLYKDMCDNWMNIIGCGSFIFKPNTVFTKKWIESIHDILDIKEQLIKSNRGNIWGDNSGYPLSWTEIMGNIFHPLCHEYHNELIKDDRVKSNFIKSWR